MKAAYITAQQGGPEVIENGDVEQPQVGAGEILLQVHAVGISPQELEWVPTWKTADGQERAKPIIMYAIASHLNIESAQPEAPDCWYFHETCFLEMSWRKSNLLRVFSHTFASPLSHTPCFSRQ